MEEGKKTRKKFERGGLKWGCEARLSDCCTLTHRERGKESESRVLGLQPTSATVQLLCRELTQRRPFRGEREKTLKMPEKKKNNRKTGKENDRAGGGKGQKREKNITTKGCCKEEYRQIMRMEKNEEWEEGL